ncbi:hypothetical protein [Dyadobacter tibetensis]|nr:hypothetical protein [Dyadobacter tibetensis]
MLRQAQHDTTPADSAQPLIADSRSPIADSRGKQLHASTGSA